MFIDINKLTEEENKKLKKLLSDNNISFVSTEDGEHLYHAIAYNEYLDSTHMMNEYNQVILSLAVLAACGEFAPNFTFTAEIFDQDSEGREGVCKQFSNYQLVWGENEDNVNRGMNTVSAGLESILSFDGDPLTLRDDIEMSDDFDNYIKLF